MSGISELIASHTLEAKGGKKPAPKAAPSKGKAPPASKTEGGLQIKLDALAKKFPGVSFLIKKFKNKKNAILVKGIGKMPMAQFSELAKQIPNTSHIPQRIQGNVAVFTLFGAKEITGSENSPYALFAAKSDADRGRFLSVLMKACSGDEGKKLVAAFNDKDAETFNTLWAGVSGKVSAALTAADLTMTAASKSTPKGPRPYFLLIEKPATGGKWGIAFGDYDRKVVAQEMSDQKDSNRGAAKADKMTYKVIKSEKDTQTAITETVRAMNRSVTASDDEPQSRTIRVTPLSQFLTAQADKKKVDAPRVTPPLEDTLTAAITNTSQIDNMILQKVADGARKSADGAVRIADLRMTLPADIGADAVDAALTRMHLDQVLNLQPGSLSDITGSLKIGPDRFTKIYPTDSLMQVYASDDSDLKAAKQAHMDARSAYDKKPGPQTKSRLDSAKEVLAKLIKKVAKQSPVPFAGPPKGKRTGKTMTASDIKAHDQQRLATLKRMHSKTPTDKTRKAIAILEARVGA